MRVRKLVLNERYAGKVDRAASEAAVAKAEQGDFLVRESTTAGAHRLVLCVNDNGQVRTYLIFFNARLILCVLLHHLP